MLIRFTRGKHKPDTLACVRDDGSCTWAPLNFTTHDFGHYAIETTLGWRDSFFGLLAQGWSIADFGQVDPATGRKTPVPAEALQTEALAGLLDMERLSGCSPDYADFLDMLACSCTGLGLTVPFLTPAQLAAIRACHAGLMRAWQRLSPGETLELFF